MHRQKIHIRCERKDRVRADVFGIVRSIIKSEFANITSPVLIAVGGPGGTGKTTFSRELAEVLQDAAVLRLDDYKTPRSIRAAQNVFGAHPEANEMELLSKHFGMLKNGKALEKPVYNHDTGIADKVELFTPGKYIILDGEVSTYSEFAVYIDFSIFIDSNWKTQLHTRLNRDINDKNYDKEKAVATFLHSNIREFEEYGAGSKNSADIHIYCESDYRLTLESMSDVLFKKYDSLLGGEYSRVGLKGFLMEMVTPFSKEGGVDKGAFVDHLQYLHECGVHRIFIGGYAGEFYLMTHSERRDLLSVASRYFPGYVTYNVSSVSLFEAIEHVKVAEELGADGVFALPPIVPVGIADSVLERYFRELYETAVSYNLTMMIYNSPASVINRINKSVLRKLPELYINDSKNVSDLAIATDKYFCGEDRRIAESVAQGGIGFITGASNANPQLYLDMEEAIENNIQEKIAKYQARISDDLYYLGEGGNITHKKIKIAVSKYLPGYPVYSRSPYL